MSRQMFDPKIDRRSFIARSSAAGALLVLGFPMCHLRAQGAGNATLINSWLAISADGFATIFCPSAEMGQGVYSTLPAIVAEELAMPWDKVGVELARGAPEFANPVIGLHATFESTSVRGHFEPLLLAGASAREMLIGAAAVRWGVAASACKASAGKVLHPATGRELGYGEVAGEASRISPPERPALTARQQWKLLGTRLPRKDTPAKVAGTAVYGIDVDLPGLLTGTVIHAPFAGGSLGSVDAQPALEVRGVRHVVPLSNAVVVVAENYWQARKGALALEPEWLEPEAGLLNDEGIGRLLDAAVSAPATFTDEADEDVDALLEAGEGQLLESDFAAPYLAHATMEPMNATAHFRGETIEIWAPTQAPQLAQFAVAGAFSTSPDKVIVNSTFLGGGFGRRSETDFIIQAVAASQAAGAPVKVLWTREEDTRNDFYRPRGRARLTARLTPHGRIAAWRGRYASQSIMGRLQPDTVANGIDNTSLEGAIHLPYDLGSRRTEYALVGQGLPVGFWRSPGHNKNAFFTEAFIEELAEAAGKDPLTFRMDLLRDRPRHARVLARAAEMIGYGSGPADRHVGIALHEAHGSIVAEGVEIEWLGDGAFRLPRISCVIDCGVALNPDTIEAQLESGIVYALSAALVGEINVEHGRVRQATFNDYPVLTMRQMPSVDMAIIEGGGAPGGVGEPSTPPLAPALAGALYSATGSRIRELPLSRSGLRLVSRYSSANAIT
jgi:isoquinoline 1-oxidoreductase beta subunit